MNEERLPQAVTITDLHLLAILQELRALREEVKALREQTKKRVTK